MEKQKVVVGISGGVDSSVAALLLKQQNFEVIGLHMKTAGENSDEEEMMAKQVASQIGIELVVINYKDEMDKVKEYFISEYKKGRTPNPCVMCNREVKFKPFIDFANSINADYFATGHYAKVERKNGKTYLLKATDENKDQTYFLNQLTDSQLEKVLFPLGDKTKDEIRAIAENNNLITAKKKDSFDLCFVGNKKFKEYMAQNYPDKAGKILDIASNKQVGTHNGLTKFTLGQRKGLNIGGQKDEFGRWFVVKKDIENNILYVSTDEQYLMATKLIASNFNFIPSSEDFKDEFECFAKIRYRQNDQKCKVKVLESNKVEVEFNEPQRAIALGQYCVLYNGNYCLGGGVIDEVE